VTHLVTAAISLLAATLAIALFREVRLRRCLQTLLAKLINHWRTAYEDTPPVDPAVNPAPVDPARPDGL